MLCIFNPEHDLCLANGNAHFVPPLSALRFAEEGAALMRILYPEGAAVPAARAAAAASAADVIVPWGWNRALKAQLLKQGLPAGLMPSDGMLDEWRLLQHRSTVLQLQPDCRAAAGESEVCDMIADYRAVVLKAPWSGAGRGIRWVTGALSALDRAWVRKVVRTQGCVIVEPRRQVAENFALEYRVGEDGPQFVGYSLFVSAGGVYQGNLLLPDEEIARRVGFSEAERAVLEGWLSRRVAGRYRGPLGVDYILSPDGAHHLAEINFRHTMGLVAHEYLAGGCRPAVPLPDRLLSMFRRP